ncbi:uncharacterized protein LOC144934546 [Lampetra fluviatilis]
MASTVLWLLCSLGMCLLARAQEHDGWHLRRGHEFPDKAAASTATAAASAPFDAEADEAAAGSQLAKWQDSHEPGKPRGVPPQDILRLLQRGPPPLLADPSFDKQQQQHGSSAKGGGHLLRLLSERREGSFPPHFLTTNAVGAKAGAAGGDVGGEWSDGGFELGGTTPAGFSWGRGHLDDGAHDFGDDAEADEDVEEEEEEEEEEERHEEGEDNQEEADEEDEEREEEAEEEERRAEDDGQTGEEERDDEDEQEQQRERTSKGGVDEDSPYDGGEPQEASTTSREPDREDAEDVEDAAAPTLSALPLPGAASPGDEEDEEDEPLRPGWSDAERAAVATDRPPVWPGEAVGTGDGETTPETTPETFATDSVDDDHEDDDDNNNGNFEDGDVNANVEDEDEGDNDHDGDDEDVHESYPRSPTPADPWPGAEASEEPVASALPTDAGEALPEVRTVSEVEGQQRHDGGPTPQPRPPCPGGDCPSDEHGTIIAIIVTVLCATLVVAVIAVWCYKKRQQQQQSSTFQLNGKGHSRQRENIEMHQTV